MNVTNRDASLDGLRGLAALAVVFNHLVVAFYPGLYWGSSVQLHFPLEPTLGNTPLALLWAGHFAVCIFFVMSGFALSAMCRYSQLSLIPQLVRRYIRLTIPVVALTLGAFLLYQGGLFFNGTAAPFTFSNDWLTLAYHPTASFFKVFRESMLSVYISRTPPVTDILWTIRMEMLGSLFVIIGYYFFGKRLPSLFYTLAVLLFGMLLSVKVIYFLPFAIGVAYFETKAVVPKLSTLPCLLFVVLGLFLGSTPMLPNQYAMPVFHAMDPILPHTVGAILLVYAVLHGQVLRPALNSRLAQFLGKISYCLYLTHFIVICTIGCFAFLQLKAVGLGYGLNTLFVFVLSTLVSVLVAYGLTVFVDNPGIHLSKQCGQWLNTLLKFPFRPQAYQEPDKQKLA